MLNYHFTHCIIKKGKTIVNQFCAVDDDSAAILARAYVKRAIAETKDDKEPLTRADFRLAHRQYKTNRK